MTRCILVLGGYGNFGRRIAAALAIEPDVHVLIAGRSESKAAALAKALGGNTRPLTFDRGGDLAKRLRALNVCVLVNTVGPFQGQGYDVAQACISAGCHYVDIADGRDYVASIGKLDAQARASRVLIVAGASSLPALSSAVVDHFCTQFARLDSIEHAISAGAKPPGIATMQGVLGYVGRPFTQWQEGRWQIVHGWQDIVTRRFPGEVGARRLANCDVPDLVLFPQRYPSVRSVRFRAGVGFAATTLAVWALSWLVRARLMKNLARHASALQRAATIIEPLGTRWSAMQVQLDGVDREQRPLHKIWTVLAGDNHGVDIPCLPAIALTRKLIREQLATRGAMPCMGLLTVNEILGALPNLNLRVIETE